MKLPFLRMRGLITIHTPAICDSGSPSPETRANAGLAGSTVLIKAVHVRGLKANQSRVCPASGVGSRP